MALRHGPGPPGDERPYGAGDAGESHPPGQVSGHWRWWGPAGAGGGMGATGSSHGVPAWLSACTKQADKGHISRVVYAQINRKHAEVTSESKREIIA